MMHNNGLYWSTIMKIRALIITITLACCPPVLAEFETVVLVNAVEAAARNVILPASVHGMVSYRPCAESCDEEYERARLTADTSFIVQGKTVKYEDFKKAHADIKNVAESGAFISVDVARIIVTSIELAKQ